MSFSAAGVPLVLCLSPGGSSIASFTANLRAQLVWLDPRLLASEWVLMCVAMMAPLFIAVLQNMSAYSFRGQRCRNIALVSVSYGFVLGIVGVPAVCLVLVARTALDSAGLAAVVPLVGFGVAALWHVSPPRMRIIRQCHRAFYPSLSARSVLAYGLSQGWSCGLACLPAMLATMMSAQGIVPMLAVTHLLVHERTTHRPPTDGVRWFLIATGAVLTLANL